MALEIKTAYAYYRDHMLNEERLRLFEARGLPVVGSVSSYDWELFGALLTGDVAEGGYGSDLSQHEVKSAVIGNSFEYQYHLRGGVEKLYEDMRVQHVFISYSRDYRDVTVRLIEGETLAETFESWRAGLMSNYEGPQRKQRYRKSISYGRVVRLGRVVMDIRDGHLVM